MEYLALIERRRINLFIWPTGQQRSDAARDNNKTRAEQEGLMGAAFWVIPQQFPKR